MESLMAKLVNKQKLAEGAKPEELLSNPLIKKIAQRAHVSSQEVRKLALLLLE